MFHSSTVCYELYENVYSSLIFQETLGHILSKFFHAKCVGDYVLALFCVAMHNEHISLYNHFVLPYHSIHSHVFPLTSLCSTGVVLLTLKI